MPFDNLPYQDLVNRYGFVPANHAAPQLFDVSARRVFDERGEELPGYRRIVREDTGRTLNVVTEAYEFIDNKVAFGAFEDAIRSSTLDAGDLQIATDFAGDGARVFRQYLFPRHEVEIRRGVTVALRIVMFNSYDKSSAFVGRAGGYTWVCANTAMWGSDIGNFRFRHAGEIDVEAAVQGLVGAAESHVAQARRMREWPRIDIADADAQRMILALPKVSDAQVDRLVHSWLVARDDEASPQNGPNLWTLYAVLTAWSTHGDTALGAMAGAEPPDRARSRVRFDREKQVAGLIDGKAWKAVEDGRALAA